MRKQPHVLVIPYPAQGHVPPLLKLATKIAENGIEVTFVNTDLIAAKVMAAMPEESEGWSLIKFVSISNGIGQEEDRTDFDKTTNTMLRVMPGNLKDLIEKINQSSDNEQITCVIADILVVWAIELAQKMGIPRAAFVPYGPATLALSFHIKKLTEAGILDMNGNATSDGLISISEESLPWKANELAWSFPFNKKTQKVLFGALCAVDQIVKISNWVLSNSFYELDSSSCDLVPSILPIGPLLASNNSRHLAGSFRPEDSTCLSWLDKQPIGSVIYVALGSTGTLNQQQFDELAIGLESLGQPFLWVVRSDLMTGSVTRFPDGFEQRVGG
ncbi:UDP-glycosyltransferase 83A1-like [Pistacia vera]|uniref:UDP-glycosyltransferase 83A1-like n=1 Tax=Pistacia vera TaxID=55513 RepID=UPI001263CD38|nr:UDP-glycosyltransferase 83A1-like [Pistacia vera]